MEAYALTLDGPRLLSGDTSSWESHRRWRYVCNPHPASPSLTCAITDFCKQERRVLFVLKPSRLHSGGLGGLAGTNTDPATPKKSSIIPYYSIDNPTAPALTYLHAIISTTRSTIKQAGNRRMWVSTPSLQRLMTIALCILPVANGSRRAQRPVADLFFPTFPQVERIRNGGHSQQAHR